MIIRLNKFLADAGIASRRQSDELISAGRITVNNKTITELGIKIDPERDVIQADGKVVQLREKMLYFALYKPRKVVSTADDPQNRQKVIDFLPKAIRVYPIGRLDFESEGLIILTNDGELTYQLTHPSFEHQKKYRVLIKFARNSAYHNKADRIKQTFEKGLDIDNKIMQADLVENIQKTNDADVISFDITLHTGYNRQIRKMCAKIGADVTSLTRIQIGKLKLTDLDLRPGQYKEIKKEQII